MTNTVTILRTLLIYGLCLPLAVFLGYLLAVPLDRGSLLFLAVAIFLPLIPILLRWHHVLLIVSWNVSMVLFFLPGSPYLWIVMTALSLGLTILQHILKRNVVFVSVPSVTWPLVFLTAVILVTANLTGGIGLRSLGGDAYGGRRYVFLLAGIAGYFALTSHRVPPGRAVLYVALYFLGTVTMIVGSLAPWIPGSLRIIYALFPVDNIGALYGRVQSENLRLGGVTFAAVGVLCFMLARHGIREIMALGERWRFLPLSFKGGLGVTQPWRLLIFLGVAWIGLLGGYRSVPITMFMTVFLLFCLEGLHRTRLLPTMVLLGVLLLAIGLPFVDQLPRTVQRSLSFLPIAVNPMVKIDADTSSEWRLKIWREVVPTIPEYLLVGKGYAIDPRELEQEQAISDYRGGSNSGDEAALASDYHNGPLSVLIPLGAFGALGFLWFLGAALRVLINNYRYGLPEHRQINTFMLAYFVTKTLFFLVVYGSFQNDLMVFTGLIGLSCSINGGMRQLEKPAPAPNPAYLPFRLPKTAKG